MVYRFWIWESSGIGSVLNISRAEELELVTKSWIGFVCGNQWRAALYSLKNVTTHSKYVSSNVHHRIQFNVNTIKYGAHDAQFETVSVRHWFDSITHFGARVCCVAVEGFSYVYAVPVILSGPQISPPLNNQFNSADVETLLTWLPSGLRTPYDEHMDFLSVTQRAHGQRSSVNLTIARHVSRLSLPVSVHRPILCNSCSSSHRYLPPPCRSPAAKQVNHRCCFLPVLLAAVFSLVHSHTEKSAISSQSKNTTYVKERCMWEKQRKENGRYGKDRNMLSRHYHGSLYNHIPFTPFSHF